MKNTLYVSYHKDFSEIVLNNSKYGNSFGLEQASLLLDEIDKLRSSKMIVFRSSLGSNFCSGGNLKFYANETKQEGAEANKLIAASLKALSELPIVSLCIVEGNCFGGGMELISCFDYIVSTPGSFFGFWQRKIALSFGWGGQERWKSRLSLSQIKKFCLTSANISAYAALRQGLIDQVIPGYQIDSFIKSFIRKEQELPRAPINTLKELNKNETKAFGDLWFNDEHKVILAKYKKDFGSNSIK